MVPEKADPDPILHASALLALIARFRQLGGSHSIHLVHAVASQGQIQLHFAQTDGDQVRCQCGVSKPFSFAVCAGERGSPKLPLVFPAGHYSVSNYPAGYSALIAGFSGDSFVIQGVGAPAVLRQVPLAGGDEYFVAQKMQITQSQ
jgi:hypothetical protein